MDQLVNTILALSGRIAGSLVGAIGEGILLAVCVSICLRLIPNIKPAIRFIVWIAVFIAALSLHVLPFARSISLPESISGGSFHLDARWGVLIICLWAISSLVRVAKLIRNILELRRIAVTAVPVSLDAIDNALLNCGSRSAQLCTSTAIDRPSVVGFFYPRILLPPSLLQKLSPQELEHILRHEMEHLHRHDDWTNLIQKIGLIVFPLNPVLNWLDRRLCLERELACDDCVLQSTPNRKGYAFTLTNLAEHSLLHRGATLALGAWEKQSELSHRVHRILRRPEEIMGSKIAHLFTAMMIVGVFGVTIALSHSPQLVSFTNSSSGQAPMSASPVAISEPVRHSQQSFPTLVKAVMPEPQKSTSSHYSRVRHPSSIKPVHRPSQPKPRSWIVLTSWQAVPITSHSTLSISESTESTYTAVPVENGWLIIQL